MRSFKTLLVVVLGSVLLLSLSTQLRIALAQEGTSQTFVIQAGTGQGNYRAFAPATVQVHPGDTVRWITRGCNVHFADGETPLWLPGEFEGKPVLNTNPAAFVGNVQSGDSFTGGEANSGYSFGGPPPPFFELVINAADGTYSYYCDTYSGMVGVIEVVDAATAIPTPADVTMQGLDEIAAALGALNQPMQAAMDAPAQTTDNGVIVTIGLSSGRAQALDFFPNAVVIEAGQSVTWVVPEDLPEPTVGLVNLPIGASRFEGEQAPFPFTFIPADGDNPPAIRLAVWEANPPSGSTVTADMKDVKWGNAMMSPGDSYTLTFTEPGVYRYLNTSMGTISGYVIVQAADAP